MSSYLIAANAVRKLADMPTFISPKLACTIFVLFVYYLLVISTAAIEKFGKQFSLI